MTGKCDEIDGESTFDNIEDCAKEALEYWLSADGPYNDDDLEDDCKYITVMETEPLDFNKCADNVIDDLQDIVDDYACSNYYCEDPLFDLTDDYKKRLHDLLTEAISECSAVKFMGGRTVAEYKLTRKGYELCSE